MRKLLLSASLLALFAGSVEAEGFGSRSRVSSSQPWSLPAETGNFNGFGASVIGGYEWGGESWGAGGELYYHKQFQSGLVLGAVVDVMGFWNSQESSWDGGEGIFADFGTVEITWLASLRGKMGWAVGPFLPFVTAGVAWTGGDWSSEGQQPGDTDSGGFTKSGWVVSAGVQTLITEKVTATVEFLHYDFDGRISFNEAPSLDADRNVLRIGLGLKF